MRVLVLLGVYRANGPYHGVLREVCELLRALGPAGTNLLAGCTVVTCCDPSRAHVGRSWTTFERVLLREGHELQVLHQLDREAYYAWVRNIEEQLGFEIIRSPAIGLLEASGVCHWLDYGPSGRAEAPATELSIRIWELIGST